MQIVIDIPEERFKDIQRIAQVISYRRLPALEKVIANGIVLPENHGRLIDADDLEHITIIGDEKGFFKRIEAPTVLEADKGESGE